MLNTKKYMDFARWVDQALSRVQAVVKEIEDLDAAWKNLINSEYGYLVSEHDFRNAISKARQRAATTIASRIHHDHYPLVEWLDGKWGRKADELGSVGATIKECIRHYTEDGEALTLKHLERLLTSVTNRGNGWNGPRTLERSKRYIKFHVPLWDEDMDSFRIYYWVDNLRAIEFVANLLCGMDVLPAARNTGHLAWVFRNNETVGKFETAWSRIPVVRPYKNGRLDVYFQDETLAIGVRKYILDLVNGDES